MIQRSRAWRLLALLFALTLIAAACGGDDDDDDGTAAGDSTSTTAADDEGGEDSSTSSSTETSIAPNEGDGVLKFGTLLPETGSLAFLGPPEIAGVNLAIQEINDAGGVLGQDVELVEGDSGDTSTDIANQTVDRELAEGVDAIIGAASSGVSLTVIDKIVGAGVIQFSPANTAKELSTYEDDGLYFRTAPSDILQGQVLGEIIVEDGFSNVGLFALDDPYGTGLLEDTTASIEASGGQVVESIVYDPQAQTFDSEVDDMVRANPDAVVVIGFDESARLIATMIEKGVGPADVQVYGVDGNMGNALGEQFTEPGALEGMKGTTPLTQLSDEFKNRLLEVDPELVDFNYAGESYDAVIVTALAAVVANTDVPTDVATEINGVTKDGEKCTSFQECLDLINGGTTDIDYDGVTGPLTFTDAGEPGEASYGVLQFGPENAIDDSLTEFRTAQL
ncbi:MAG TPA: ABC transporter substrate-binding protein [Acidimicrobiales bacterium]